MKFFNSFFLSLILTLVATVSAGKDLPKIAVWDLNAGNINPSYAQDLTSILVSEISKLEKYEVYSQENVRTLAGWTAERMQLGCTDTKCLTALGQMDIAKLISGRVGKIGNRYSVSLNIFDTQNARSEKSVSEFGRSEDELIDLVQVAVRKLLGIEVVPSKVEEKGPGKATTGLTSPVSGRSFADPATGMEFVLVKGGCYEMGDTFGDGIPNEKPAHEVCVSDFYLGKYEVTVGEFRKFVNDTGYRTEGERGDGCGIISDLLKSDRDRDKSWRDPGFSQDDRHPVVCVSWNDTKAFADWLKGKTEGYYRLPTEAEWEYAARSMGKNYKYSWGTGGQAGNIMDISYKRRFPKSLFPIWDSYDDGYVFTAPVGKYAPNELGFYDMSGNVLEWVSDWYDEGYYKNSPKDNPQGPGSGQDKVLRGGSWASIWRGARAAYRCGFGPAERNNSIGFRLGLSIP